MDIFNWFKKKPLLGKELAYIAGLPYSLIKYPENPNFINLAKGEIVKMNFHKDCLEGLRIGEQLVGLEGGYDWIWVYLGNSYAKVIMKVEESPWSCQ